MTILYKKSFFINILLNLSFQKVNSDSFLVIPSEGAAAVPLYHAGLADAAVPDYHHLERHLQLLLAHPRRLRVSPHISNKLQSENK